MKLIDLQKLSDYSEIQLDDRVLMPWDMACMQLEGKISDDPDYFSVKELLAIEDDDVQQKVRHMTEEYNEMLEKEYHQAPMSWTALLAYLQDKSRILHKQITINDMHCVSGCNSEKAGIR
ncbi:MAG: hypothetical protein SOI44_07485 [Lactimicrobium sp.]|jgi:hypothetical protein|uniref:hypothetical protein n=1 Tax=Lactimicrobium sp. TaxID=2563780 RepID=UPI002F34F2C5